MATVSIPLTQGKFAQIDEEDFGLVSRFKWCARRSSSGRTYYALHNVCKDGVTRTLLMHRVILGLPDSFEGDHIDGDGLNNTRVNLRVATTSQNHCNSGKRSHNTSGYKGVSWEKSRGLWAAEARMDGRRIRCGRFATAEEAARAYDRAARELQGDFARLNFPDDTVASQQQGELSCQ